MSIPEKRTGSRGHRRSTAGPKNGRLFLAVVAAILLMPVLAVLNVHLMDDGRPRSKTDRPSHSETDPRYPRLLDDRGADAGNDTAAAPPKVTFYKQLETKDKRTSRPVEQPETPAKEPDKQVESKKTADADPVESGNAAPKEAPTEQAGEPKIPVKAAAKLKPRPPKERTPEPEEPAASTPEPPSGMYAVQVGAFADPMVAQQRAGAWQARGYVARLRPVARPGTGVMYRLYLGDFTSKKKADELIARLKSKEGVNALRLRVPN